MRKESGEWRKERSALIPLWKELVIEDCSIKNFYPK